MLIAFTYLAGVRWTDLRAILNADVGPNGNVWNKRTVWLLCMCIVRNFVYYCIINCSIIVAFFWQPEAWGFAQNHRQAMLSFLPFAGICGCSHIRIKSGRASVMNHVRNISFNNIFYQYPCATLTNRNCCSWTNSATDSLSGLSVLFFSLLLWFISQFWIILYKIQFNNKVGLSKTARTTKKDSPIKTVPFCIFFKD